MTSLFANFRDFDFASIAVISSARLTIRDVRCRRQIVSYRVLCNQSDRRRSVRERLFRAAHQDGGFVSQRELPSRILYAWGTSRVRPHEYTDAYRLKVTDFCHPTFRNLFFPSFPPFVKSRSRSTDAHTEILQYTSQTSTLLLNETHSESCYKLADRFSPRLVKVLLCWP